MRRQGALYARVSSDRQAEEGTLESQLASLQTYCDHHDYAIDADMIFIDDGFSGATLARPGLDTLRDQARVGAIDEPRGQWQCESCKAVPTPAKDDVP